MERINANELNLDDLDKVTGGTSAVKPNKKIGNTLLNNMGSNITKGSVATASNAAVCTACGGPLSYQGNARIEGGNTGVYKCNNPECPEYGKEKYNDEIKK